NNSLSSEPVIDWSVEAQRAIVPAGPGGIFGSENYGNKFPGEAAVYMAIVHAAIYDAAFAIEGGYEPYAIAIDAPADTSAAAAIATAAHHTIVGLQPALGLTPAQQAILYGDYDNYMKAISESDSQKTNGIRLRLRACRRRPGGPPDSSCRRQRSEHVRVCGSHRHPAHLRRERLRRLRQPPSSSHSAPMAARAARATSRPTAGRSCHRASRRASMQPMARIRFSAPTTDRILPPPTSRPT